ncbi:MAG: thioredoxin family protein [Sedimentisphaerales bacterium]|nr:thioredoxin family protein [Sedimentisphaerales bacterium]
MKITLRTLLSVVFMAFNASAASDIWTIDYEAAKKQAAQSGRDLLLDFTGSDWCGWCIRLDKEVFDQDYFKTEAVKDFVLVKLDFPRDSSGLTQETKDQNQMLAEKHNIGGYPTIILANAAGEPYESTGYREGGPEEYVKHLREAKSTIGSVRKALDLAGKETDPAKKVVMLDEAISKLSQASLDKYFASYVDEIIALDKDNAQGLRNKYLLPREIDALVKMGDDPDALMAKADEIVKELKLEGEDLEMINNIKTEVLIQKEMQKLNELGDDVDKLSLAIDEIVTKLKLDTKYKQQVVSQKIMIHLQISNDMDAAIKATDEAIAIDPESEYAGHLIKFKEGLIQKQQEDANKEEETQPEAQPAMQE